MIANRDGSYRALCQVAVNFHRQKPPRLIAGAEGRADETRRKRTISRRTSAAEGIAALSPDHGARTLFGTDVELRPMRQTAKITAAMLYDLVQCPHRPAMDLFGDLELRLLGVEQINADQ